MSYGSAESGDKQESCELHVVRRKISLLLCSINTNGATEFGICVGSKYSGSIRTPVFLVQISIAGDSFDDCREVASRGFLCLIFT